MTAANSITVTVLDIVKAALLEIGAIAQGEVPSAEDSAWVLQKLQRLIDRYNARSPMVYNVSFQRYTLLTNTQPITIGPSGNFDVSMRPVKLLSANLILTSGASEIDIPLAVLTDDDWADVQIKNLTSNLPTAVYFSPDWPLGNLYFWPIPTSVNAVRLQVMSVLTEFTAFNTAFTMPPAYWDAIVYPLAITLCPSYNRTASAELMELERRALKAIQVNNIESPRLTSDAAVMPKRSGAGRPDFNFLTGKPW